MLTKNKIKLIRSLELKKNRQTEGLFVAEGKKMVVDLIKSKFFPSEIFCTEELIKDLKGVDKGLISIVSKGDLERISSLKSTPDVIALFRIPEISLNWKEVEKDLTLILDTIQDPGNLGTIIRTADWFGIKNIICSEETADVYNSKTIQSSMGAIARVKVHYLNLKDILFESKKMKIPVYGTFMEGENLYKAELSRNGIVIMGNEGKGISKEVEAFIDKKISIPSYSLPGSGPESLNVAVAASIVIAEFRRRI